MYNLYGSPGTASFAVHWMLIELAVEYNIALLDFSHGENKTVEYLKISPNGSVPALIVDDFSILETGAILMWLSERHSEKHLSPSGNSQERAAWLQRMIWLANEPMPLFRQWLYPEDLPGLDRSVLQSRIESVWEALNVYLDDHKFVVGDQFTCADIQTVMLMRWSRGMPNPAASWGNINRYLNEISKRPSFIKVHIKEQLADWISK